jgi:hypothetical protein
MHSKMKDNCSTHVVQDTIRPCLEPVVRDTIHPCFRICVQDTIHPWKGCYLVGTTGRR